MNTNKQFSKLIALVLSAALVFTMMPETVSAEAAGCNHTQHDEACGYVEGVPCEHKHDDTCDYTEAVPCGHQHDEDCGWDEESKTGCTHQHNNECGYAEATPCAHTQHDDTCGYIEAAPCRHMHDENCGELVDSTKTLDKSDDTVTIAAFEPLDDEVAWRSYTVNTIIEAELDLPAALNGTDADDNPITIKGVTWKSYPEFDPAVVKGYVFSAALPEGYELAAGVTASEIRVFILPEDGAQIVPLALPAADSLAGIINGFAHGGSGTLTATASGSVVTVTGTVNNAQNQLTLNIPDGITVRWQTNYTSTAASGGSYVLRLSGAGEFEVVSGKIERNSDVGINIYTSGGKLTVSGGTVTNTGVATGTVISANLGSTIIVSDGTVSNTGYLGGIAISADTSSVVAVTGGSVSSASNNAFYVKGGAVAGYMSSAKTNGNDIVISGNAGLIAQVAANANPVNGSTDGLTVTANEATAKWVQNSNNMADIEVTFVGGSTLTIPMGLPIQGVASQYSIAVDPATENGTVTVDKTQAAVSDTVTLTIIPDTGYKLNPISLKYNSTPITGNSFNMPSEHVTIYAEFVENPHTITIDSMTNGTVTVDGNLTQAIEGTTINLTVTPTPGFQLTPGSLKYSGTVSADIPITNNRFTMPNENVTIYAEFETTPQSITSISPAFGSTSVTTQVTITGSGFLGKSNLAVTFGSASATSVTVDSDNQITCTAPAQSAGAVDVVVSSTVGSSNAVSFYYCTADTLSIFETIAGFNALTGKTLTTALTESNTVTITGDAKGVSSSLVLNIPSGVTVKGRQRLRPVPHQSN